MKIKNYKDTSEHIFGKKCLTLKNISQILARFLESSAKCFYERFSSKKTPRNLRYQVNLIGRFPILILGCFSKKT